MTLADLGALLNFLIVLAFVFLVLSLIASIVVESIAGMLGTRGRLLRERLTQMFDDEAETGFAGLLLTSPLIRSLGDGKRPPSYIPGEVFAQSVQAIIREHKIIDARDLPPVLRQLALAEGFGDEEERKAFAARLIEWYDRAMERLSGKFKRKSRLSLFIAGMILAIGFNVDTIALTSQIWTNRLALDATVRQIAELHADVAREAEKTGETAEELLNDDGDLRRRAFEIAAGDTVLKSLEIPVGWTLRDKGCPDADWAGFADGGVFRRGDRVLVCTLEQRQAEMWRAVTRPSDWSIFRIVGWLLTALAILPGAKFWFDVVGAALTIRAAGPKPLAKGENKKTETAKTSG
jgi:hypothetical protein